MVRCVIVPLAAECPPNKKYVARVCLSEARPCRCDLRRNGPARRRGGGDQLLMKQFRSQDLQGAVDTALRYASPHTDA
jgi:hypothetical protein